MWGRRKVKVSQLQSPAEFRTLRRPKGESRKLYIAVSVVLGSFSAFGRSILHILNMKQHEPDLLMDEKFHLSGEQQNRRKGFMFAEKVFFKKSACLPVFKW